MPARARRARRRRWARRDRVGHERMLAPIRRRRPIPVRSVSAFATMRRCVRPACCPLLLLLQTRGGLTAAELARELEVSVRTIHRDVEALGRGGDPDLRRARPARRHPAHRRVPHPPHGDDLRRGRRAVPLGAPGAGGGARPGDGRRVVTAQGARGAARPSCAAARLACSSGSTSTRPAGSGPATRSPTSRRSPSASGRA